MSAKWRALQHRHRYTYSSVVFPFSFLHAITRVESTAPEDTHFLEFLSKLQKLASLDTTYAQVAAAKDLSNSLAFAGFSSSALELYLEMLFIENSLPLHRTLISGIARNSKNLPFLESSLISLCKKYLSLSLEKKKRFLVSRAVLSFLSYPKLGFLDGVLQNCAVMAGLDISEGIFMVYEDISLGSRPSPGVMEQCQDAMSCLYYLLQRYPSKFFSSDDDGEGLRALEVILRAIICVLKSSSFSRDSLVAAGVSLCAALQTHLSSQQLASFIAGGIFKVNAITQSETVFLGINLVKEIGDFSLLGRICLLRGILSAVPRSVLYTKFDVIDRIPWTILYGGILPELCNYCENPIDSHFNFHVLTVTQICLQHIGEDIDAFPGDLVARLLRIIWNNLEDPLNQTVKQVHLIVDLLLEVNPQREKKGFCLEIAAELLQLGSRCKGRYAPLASVTRRLGALALLELNPRLIFDSVNAYMDDDICCAVTSFLKCFLGCLLEELWRIHGIDQGYLVYREFSLVPLMKGLLSGNSKLRSNLNTYALPVVLEVDVDSIFPMLVSLSLVPEQEERESPMIPVDNRDGALSVDVFSGKTFGNLDDAQVIDVVGGQKDAILHDVQLTDAISMEKDAKLADALFMDAASGQTDAKLNSAHFLNAKLGKTQFINMDNGKEDCDPETNHSSNIAGGQSVAALVSILKVSRQLLLVSGDIDWDHGSSSDAILRVKDVRIKVPVMWFVHALTHIDENVRIDAAESLFLNPKTASLPSALELKLMRDVIPLNMRCGSTGFQMRWNSLFRKFFHRAKTALERHAKQGFLVLDANHGTVEEFQGAQDLLTFMRWLTAFLFSSCYSSAPYERKIMSMGLILTILDVWPVVSASKGGALLHPFAEDFPSPELTLSMVGSIVDSWDRIRENSFRILLHFPSPLPGMLTYKSVKDVIMWAKKLVGSPRVRESDAGALTLRLVFRKYVLELGWTIWVSNDVVVCKHDPVKKNASFLHYISSLTDWLQTIVELGEKDLSEACKNCFVHGVLLALRYTFEELDWNLIINLHGNLAEMKTILEELLTLVMRITSLALGVVSSSAWYLPDEMEEMANDEAFVPEMVNGGDLDWTLESEGSPKPQENDQAVMVGCWLAMKEVSLLLGTIIRKTPLPNMPELNVVDKPIDSDSILDVNQLETIGGHFLQVLLKMKHNGAIDKTRAGFTALCNRLLCSNVPRLCQMTELWMDQLMERVVMKGQTVDDLLRRSAGIPAAFMALFLSEPNGAPKKLLPRALRWLIDLAVKFAEGPNNAPKPTHLLDLEFQSGISTNTQKTRDEGVVPTVHAFNVLRAAFNDTNLSVDVSGFCAEALIISIRSFSSPYWEVRNSACLAYTALIRRMVGFLNMQKYESAKRSLTSLEFFHRYPALHPFLFEELKVATRFSVNSMSDEHLESNMANAIHPSLCPILILLSRLKPSIIGNEADNPLDPFLFMPFISKCATQSNLRIRVLASRALTCLISHEKLPAVIKSISQSLPSGSGDVSTPFNSIHGLLMQLYSLIDSNCQYLNDDSKISLILGELIGDLCKCSWIGNIRSCPCPTLISSYLRVLERMLDIVILLDSSEKNNIGIEIKTLLLKLSSECLERGERSSRLAFFDPTVEEAQKQATRSFLRCFFLVQSQRLDLEGLSLSGFQEKIQSCISDPSFEVRIVTLKLLLKFIKFACNCSWLRASLQSIMMESLTVEDNPRCIYYLLSIIYSWNMIHFTGSCGHDVKNTRGFVHIGVVGIDSVLSFWERLRFLMGLNSLGKTKGMLLCCMSMCVRRFLGFIKDPKWISISRCIDQFLVLVKNHSLPSEPVSLRKAVGEGIIASGLLQAAISTSAKIQNGSALFDEEKCDSFSLYGSQVLEAWFICIQLLEDEDVGLRQKIAEEVQVCIASHLSSQGILMHSGPLQVDRVINLSFEFLTSTFSHWIVYVDCLLRWIFDSGDGRPAQKGSNLVRQVFDKEIDNHHEEKLLICQICCSHCERLIRSPSFTAPKPLEFLQSWKTRFINQLVTFLDEFLDRQGKEGWVGGVGNHKDAFLGIYGPLLGLYALLQSPQAPPLVSEESQTLDEAIRPFLSNPLISGLYSLVKDGGGQTFDPYFLLK